MSVRYHLGKFPPDQPGWSQLVSLIGPANAALARYDGGVIRTMNEASGRRAAVMCFPELLNITEGKKVF